jgi:hypothetical protein
MMSELDELRRRITELRETVEVDIEARRERWRYRIDRGRAVFEDEVRRRHAELRVGLMRYLRGARPLVVLTAPVIYGLILPFALFDLCVSLYQAICFPVYGIKKVRRHDHFVIDRQYLAYLNDLEKLNCVYCGYANGLMSYVRKIAGRTEAYWCPIKHARRMADPHQGYDQFVDYGDAEGYKQLCERAKPPLD